jgi:aminopeptidase N
MSTYLLTLIVGKFEYEECRKYPIKVRGYCPIGFKKSISHFVHLAAESIVLYESYFGLPYPLTKLDLVACHSLNVRAMENWGCITFLRSVILSDPDSEPSLLFQRNARTVAHEVSHMWFGNLVTMEWWEDIWLNEGFARFSEHHIIDTLRPQFKIWD